MIDLKPACNRMIEVLTGVTDSQLAAPSPCAEYTVGDLIDHVDLVSRGSGAAADRDRDRVAEHVRALGAAWDDPTAWLGRSGAAGLELSNELWGRITLTELVVHGWDIAVATGQPFDLPGETLRACLEHVAEFVPNAPVPGLWGPAVGVPVDATLLDRIVAATGRTPREAPADR